MYYHPSENDPYGYSVPLTRREKLFRIISWIMNVPMFWLFWGFLIANITSMNMIVEIFKQLDKTGICR